LSDYCQAKLFPVPKIEIVINLFNSMLLKQKGKKNKRKIKTCDSSKKTDLDSQETWKIIDSLCFCAR